MGASVIPVFRGEHAFLSNFHPAVVHMDDQPYPTVEHAYQAAKFDAKAMAGATGIWGRDGTPFTVRQLIQAAPTPGLAKRYGKMWPSRAGWDEVKLVTMKLLVYQKFHDHWSLRRQLLATGDAELVEGNWWGDTFWGRVDGVGENHLGRILMQVRKELQDV